MQSAKWTAEGAVKGHFVPSILRRVGAYVSCRRYDSISQSAREFRESRWHRGNIFKLPSLTESNQFCQGLFLFPVRCAEEAALSAVQAGLRRPAGRIPHRADAPQREEAQSAKSSCHIGRKQEITVRRKRRCRPCKQACEGRQGGFLHRADARSEKKRRARNRAVTSGRKQETTVRRKRRCRPCKQACEGRQGGFLHRADARSEKKRRARNRAVTSDGSPPDRYRQQKEALMEEKTLETDQILCGDRKIQKSPCQS